jgi:hypothetical protein
MQREVAAEPLLRRQVGARSERPTPLARSTRASLGPRFSVDLDFDLARFELFPLVDGDRENAVLERGLNLVLVRRRGQLDFAAEAPGATLVDVIALLVPGLFLDVLRALDGQNIVLQGDVDLVLGESG